MLSKLRAELHPNALEIRNQLSRRKILRAIERHVFEEVRQPALLIAFVQ
jgi:hypothetical protein